MSDSFYSYGQRLKKLPERQQVIDRLHQDARRKAKDAGQAVTSSKGGKKFVTKGGKAISAERTVGRPVVNNPYVAQMRRKELMRYVSERARK